MILFLLLVGMIISESSSSGNLEHGIRRTAAYCRTPPPLDSGGRKRMIIHCDDKKKKEFPSMLHSLKRRHKNNMEGDHPLVVYCSKRRHSNNDYNYSRNHNHKSMFVTYSWTTREKYANNNDDDGRRMGTTTSLAMGLRTFFRKRVMKDNNDDGDDDKNDNKGRKESPGDVKEALEAIKADLEDYVQSSSSTQKTDDGAKEPFSSNNGNSKNSLYMKSINDKIRRMKSGGMTDDEKSAFLNRATSPATPSSLRADGKMASQKNIIRQSIPSSDSDNNVNVSLVKNGNSNIKPSPFPKDSLWNTVIGRNTKSEDTVTNSTDANKNVPPGVIANERAKREYLDMITDPNRFKGYAAMGDMSSTTSSTSQPLSSSSASPPPLKLKTMDQTTPSNERKEINADANISFSDNNQKLTPQEDKVLERNDLASKLEKAAMLQTQRDKQRELELKKQREEERELERQQLILIRERQMEESRKQQEAMEERKRQEEELIRKEMEKKKQQEEARMKQLLDSQEAYWKEKLKKQEQRKIGRSTTSTPVDTIPTTTPPIVPEEKDDDDDEKEEEILDSDGSMESSLEEENQEEDTTNVAPVSTPVPRSAYSSPTTSDLKSNISSTLPQDNQGVSSSSFVQQQEQKRKELDRILQMRQEQLKSLNSPLPSPISSSSPSPAVITTTNARTTTNSNGNSYVPPPGLSIAELTRMKSSSSSTPATNVDKTPVPAPTSSSSSSPRLSLSEMTMFRPPAKEKQSREKPAAPRRVVRQRVPLPDNDEDEDDFMTYDRNSENAQMSIKDIMSRQNAVDDDDNDDTSKKSQNNKSKMWGIDMDKLF